MSGNGGLSAMGIEISEGWLLIDGGSPQFDSRIPIPIAIPVRLGGSIWNVFQPGRIDAGSMEER